MRRRRYRRNTHIGRVRLKLAEKIVELGAKEGAVVDCDPADLRPAEGYWRTPKADVKRWEGRIGIVTEHGKRRTVDISSWDTMTDCCRGMVIEQGNFSGFWGIEVGADR